MPAIPKARAKLFAPFSYGGIVGALVFFGFSLTPSLLPRSPLLQGLVSGLSIAGGYGLGALLFWAGPKAIVVAADGARPPHRLDRARRGRRRLRRAGPLHRGALEQRDPRAHDARPGLAVDAGGGVADRAAHLVHPAGDRAPAALGGASASATCSRAGCPRSAAIVLGAVLIALPLLIVFSGLLEPGLVARRQRLRQDQRHDRRGRDAAHERRCAPVGRGRSSRWDSLGLQGRNFIGRGPDAAALEQFSGEPAQEPIRVYAGVESAPTAEERAALAVKELDRTDAWSREVLVVMGATGTGWIEPQSADSLEYLWNGDTAEVTIQYSYLPSWISFLVDKQRAEDAGQALFAAVHERWAQLPEGERPRLLAYGLSLGSFAQQAAFPDGSTPSPRRRTARCSSARPTTRPSGAASRTAATPAAPSGSPSSARDRRSASPRHPRTTRSRRVRGTSPVSSTCSTPPTPSSGGTGASSGAGPTGSPSPAGRTSTRPRSGSRSSPSVQVTVDQFHGTGVPNGHGHNYGNMMASAWAQLGRPPAGPTPRRAAPAEADRWLRDRVAEASRGARARRRRGRPRLRRPHQPGGPERALRAGEPGRGLRRRRRGPRPRDRLARPRPRPRPRQGRAQARRHHAHPHRRRRRPRPRDPVDARLLPRHHHRKRQHRGGRLHAAAAHPLRDRDVRGADLPRRPPRPLPAASPAVGRRGHELRRVRRLARAADASTPSRRTPASRRPPATSWLQAGAVAFVVVATGVAGSFFSWLRLRSGSILAPWLTHTGFNSIGYLGSRLAGRLSK